MPAMLRRLTAATLSLALASTPLPAFAQSPPPPPPPVTPAAPAAPTDDAVAQAGAHYARGVKLYEEDDYRAALIEFSRAYELAPNWAVLYNLGQAHYQLREYPGALKTLERYVREGGAGIAADRRAQVDREVAELRGRVARVTALSNVDGADVTLDDTPLGKTPATEPLVIGEGRHRIVVSKPGYVTLSKVVDIAGGDELTLHLDLTPEAPVPVTGVTPATVREPTSYTAAVVSGVFAVAGIATGTVFGVLAMNDKSSLNGECNSAKICPASAQSDIDAFSRNGVISTIGFGVGAAGVLLGGYLFFHERAKGGSGTARVTPWIGPGTGGVVGTF
ncbi:MAG TPA: PEGA domain-containing protein [Polyangiaceae bacterium]